MFYFRPLVFSLLYMMRFPINVYERLLLSYGHKDLYNDFFFFFKDLYSDRVKFSETYHTLSVKQMS